MHEYSWTGSSPLIRGDISNNSHISDDCFKEEVILDFECFHFLAIPLHLSWQGPDGGGEDELD